MSDTAFQGERFLWGAVGVSVLLAQCSQHIQGTDWFPQTTLHAVLTLPPQGPKTRFLRGAAPPGSCEPHRRAGCSGQSHRENGA